MNLMRSCLAPLLVLALPVAAPAADPDLNALTAKWREAQRAVEEAKRAEATAKAALQAAVEAVLGGGVVPKPPDPKPPEPKPPTDPLAQKLGAAFDADPAAAGAKREQAKDLAALYRQAAKLCADEGVGTSGELLKRVKDAAGTLVGPAALKEVRRVVGQELAAVLPTDDALTAEQRAAAAALFGKLATILDSLGG